MEKVNNLAEDQTENQISIKDLSFEKGIESLEQIVKTLETKEIPLETALNIFKEGIELVQYCSKLLDQVEKQMEILLEGPDGRVYPEIASFVVEG